jgi:hypothetical protein
MSALIRSQKPPKSGETHTASVVRAASLLSIRVEAVNSGILRGTSRITGTASLSAGGSLSALALGGLVAIGLATTETEHLVDRHLHERLVWHRFRGADMSGEGEDRQSGNRFGEHFGYGEQVDAGVVCL